MDSQNTVALKNESCATASLSSLDVWALSFGGVIGWGSFVMPGTMFLSNAGPMGTMLAVVLGGFVMIVIGANFCAMAARHKDNGGIFSYTKDILGHDHAFLSAWSLGLAYLSLVWANATAFSLLIRYLFGNVLHWGIHYRIAGYDVFGGEILLTMCIMILFLAFFSTAMWIRQTTEDLILSIGAESNLLTAKLTQNSMIQMGLIMVILFLMSNIFTTMRQREKHLTNRCFVLCFRHGGGFHVHPEYRGSW